MLVLFACCDACCAFFDTYDFVVRKSSLMVVSMVAVAVEMVFRGVAWVVRVDCDVMLAGSVAVLMHMNDATLRSS